ncbi:MAG TPA: VWA domain-containing protein, partial [Tepidisphaeraceae bacterium]|nr:VWA domain-containing protein [Tepidisphaeraceae bacterium]
MSFWQLVGLFALLSIPIVLLGLKSLAGLGPVRRWVALGARLLVLLAFLVLIAGARWDRINKDVEVIVLRDVSESTRLMSNLPASTLRDSVDIWLNKTIEEDQDKKATDRIGVISFDNQAYVDAIPAETLIPTARAVREGGNGTDVAGAIQLGLATKSYDDTSGGAMKRLVLIWDGNATQGDLDKAIDLAKANNIPIDVMPLDYEAKNEVVVERFVAPTWRRENEPFSIDVILRSTNLTNVMGDLSVLHQGTPMDLNDQEAGMQTRRRITLRPGVNKVSVPVPALTDSGVHQFKAIFEAPNVDASVAGSSTNRPTKSSTDTLLDNNVANAFTFVRGKGKVLYVDNESGLRSNFLRAALKKEGIELDPNRVGVDQFPTSMIDLQDYEAVILQNIPRGQGGLSEEQQAMLAAYVHDMGGGLVMIGGEETFGAGGWQNSKLEEVLPILMEVPAERNVPKGALALIMHSCEMANGNFWGIQCGIKAVETLSPKDEIGVLSYAWQGVNGGKSSWDFPLGERGDGTKPIEAIKNMQLGDMPDFDDAMAAALGEPGKYGLLDSDARMKHAIIISDGDPQPPSKSVLQKYIDNKITVSTIVVYPHGGRELSTMKDIAEKTGGRAYGPIESNPSQLPQIFTKEATVVRRS